MNGVRRGKGARTTVPAKDGRRAGICWTVTSPHRHPTSVGSRTSPTAGPGPVRLRRLRRRRVRPADRGLACRHHQRHRPGPDTTADRVVGPGPAKGSRSSRVSCCTTPMPGASTHPSGSPAPRAGGHRSLDRHRGRCLPQRPDGIDHRTVQDEAIATTVFHDGPYKALAEVECVAAGWVDWYNHRRLHGSLGWLTPVEYEQDHYAALSREPQPA
jgi:transposase InsO family protein